MNDHSAEYVNPVPDARWDGRRQRRFRAAAAVLGAISLLAIARLAWTALEVAHGVNFVSDLVGLTKSDGSTHKGINRAPADGVSDLPGGYASLTFAALPGEYEYTERKDEYGSFGGSSWGVATDDDGHNNFAELGHFLLAPLADPVADQTQRLGTEYPGARFSKPQAIKIDGRKGAQWKVVEANGEIEYMAWFFASVHSFRYICHYTPLHVEFGTNCKQALRTLRFER